MIPQQQTQINGEIEYLRVLKRRAIVRREKMSYRIQAMNAEIAHKIYLREK